MEFKDEWETESKKTKSVKGLQANHETALGMDKFLEFARQDLSSEAACLDDWDMGELNDMDDEGAYHFRGTGWDECARLGVRV